MWNYLNIIKFNKNIEFEILKAHNIQVDWDIIRKVDI